MSREAISGIAETVGAFGVIVSLIYVGVQIRQNTIAARVSNYQQWVDTQVSVNRGLSDEPGATELVDRANTDFASLSNAELLRLKMVFYNHFTQWNVAFTNNKLSLVDREKWQLVEHEYELLSITRRRQRKCGNTVDLSTMKNLSRMWNP